MITTAIKFNSSDHNIYLKTEGKLVYGFIKVGYKNLFYRDN